MTLAAAGVAAAPAAADYEFSAPLIYTHGLNPLAAFTGYFWPPFSGASAIEVLHSSGVPADGNAPFYVGVLIGGVYPNGGGTDGDGGGSALPEFVAPPGVSIVTDNPNYPPYWVLYPQGGGETRQTTPVTLSAGPDSGGVIAAPTDPGPNTVGNPGGYLWEYTNSQGDIGVFVPVQTTRQLNGVAASCPQLDTIDPTLLSGDDLDQAEYDELSDDTLPAPCPASGAGDAIQVALAIADGGDPDQIVTTLPLFATAPTSSGGGGGTGSGGTGGGSGGTGGGSGTPQSGGSSLAVAVPGRLSLRRVRAGVTVVISHAPAGTVTGTLASGRHVLAHAGAHAGASGKLRLVLRPSRAHARSLHAGGRLTVTVTDGTARVRATIVLG